MKMKVKQITALMLVITLILTVLPVFADSLNNIGFESELDLEGNGEDNWSSTNDNLNSYIDRVTDSHYGTYSLRIQRDAEVFQIVAYDEDGFNFIEIYAKKGDYEGKLLLTVVWNTSSGGTDYDDQEWSLTTDWSNYRWSNLPAEAEFIIQIKIRNPVTTPSEFAYYDDVYVSWCYGQWC